MAGTPLENKRPFPDRYMAILASSSDVLISPLYGNVQGDRHEELQQSGVWCDLVTGEKNRNPGREFMQTAQRVDTLPPGVQIEPAYQRLNRLQGIAERIPCLAVEEELRDLAELFEATCTGLVLEQSTWIVRSVPEVQVGQRVEIVGVQDSAMLPHVGKMGVVKPFRNYPVRGCAKVRLDGHVVDMIVPLVCCRVVISATATRLDALLEQHDALTRFRQQVLAKGEILQRKPEVFATIKKSRRVCGNVHSESGHWFR